MIIIASHLLVQAGRSNEMLGNADRPTGNLLPGLSQVLLTKYFTWYPKSRISLRQLGQIVLLMR
jgi:hypothetical protein